MKGGDGMVAFLSCFGQLTTCDYIALIKVPPQPRRDPYRRGKHDTTDIDLEYVRELACLGGHETGSPE